MKKNNHKKSHRLRNGLLMMIVAGAVVALPILLGAFRQSSVDPKAEEPLTDAEMLALVPKGRELALAGDCFGCHSLPNGEMGAGGVPIATPFGTVYSTNITPDKTFGIGDYTRADFHRALRDGVAKHKGNLYPAMPFVFTHVTTSDDLDALYAYMMSIPPLAIANQDNTGVFDWPVRPFMNFWTLLNFPDRKVPSRPDRSEEWNRGAYLVEGLAHCGACHTPRNLMMGVEFSHALEGGFVDDMAIPDITADALSQHGFSVSSLSEYLQTGLSPQGSSFAGMNTVTHFSTNQMAPKDVDAIATYLLTDSNGHLLNAKSAPLPAESIMDATPVTAEDMAAGRLAYMAGCSGCHGMKGDGIPNVVPALEGNAILAMDNPQTLIAVILNGLSTTTYTNTQRMYAMPAFKDRMDSETTADLVNWLRSQWGGLEPISPTHLEAEVKKLAH